MSSNGDLFSCKQIRRRRASSNQSKRQCIKIIEKTKKAKILTTLKKAVNNKNKQNKISAANG
jgi:hypothetical protein